MEFPAGKLISTKLVSSEFAGNPDNIDTSTPPSSGCADVCIPLSWGPPVATTGSAAEPVSPTPGPSIGAVVLPCAPAEFADADAAVFAEFSASPLPCPCAAPCRPTRLTAGNSPKSPTTGRSTTAAAFFGSVGAFARSCFAGRPRVVLFADATPTVCIDELSAPAPVANPPATACRKYASLAVSTAAETITPFCGPAGAAPAPAEASASVASPVPCAWPALGSATVLLTGAAEPDGAVIFPSLAQSFLVARAEDIAASFVGCGPEPFSVEACASAAWKLPPDEITCDGGGAVAFELNVADGILTPSVVQAGRHSRTRRLPRIATHSKELLYRQIQLFFYSQTVPGKHYRATRQPVPTSRAQLPGPSSQAPQNFPANRPPFGFYIIFDE